MGEELAEAAAELNPPRMMGGVAPCARKTLIRAGMPAAADNQSPRRKAKAAPGVGSGSVLPK